MKVFSIVGFALALTACGSQIVEFPIPSDDAGQPDSGSPDSGELDSNAPDSNVTDSNLPPYDGGGIGTGGGSCVKFECKFACMITHDSNRDACEKAHDDCYNRSACDVNLDHQCDCDRDACKSKSNYDLAVCLLQCDK